MRKIKFVIQRQSEVFHKEWTDPFTEAARKFLSQVFTGERHYVRLGRFTVITSDSLEEIAAGIEYDDHGEANNLGFSSDRLVSQARVIRRLWQLRNDGYKFVYHNELMAEIEREVLSWAEPGAIQRKKELQKEIRVH